LNIYDVFRFLIRGGPNTEANVRDLLLTVDAHEKGHPDLESYKAELAAQAKALEPPAPPDARDAELDALRAELAALRGEAAQRAAAYMPPAEPVATEVTGGPAPRL
jgi:hypothetical protein